MPQFCTQCGARVAQDARFCQACGASLQHPAVPRPEADLDGKPGNRGMLIGGVLGALVVFAGLVFWLLGHGGGPSGAELDAAGQQWLSGHAQTLLQDACLHDIDYAADAVFIDDADQETRRWMDALVSAGVYATPQPVRRGPVVQWKYAHGPQAGRFIRDGQLCVADGIAVRAVSVVPRNDIAALEGLPAGAHWPQDWALARLTLRWKGLAPWAGQPEVRARFPRLARDRRHDIILVKRGKAWELPSSMEQVSIALRLAGIRAGAAVGQAAQDFNRQFGEALHGQEDDGDQVRAAPTWWQEWLDDLRRFFGFGDAAAQ